MTADSPKLVLLHNPGAGDEEHSKSNLIDDLQAAGYAVTYQSLKKKGWRSGLKKAETVVIAGGDGTVRKVVKALLDLRPDSLPSIGLLPLGTANNIANTVYGTEDHDAIRSTWKPGATVAFDIAFVKGIKSSPFFIEALGFGVFPALMQLMKQVDDAFSDQPGLRLDIALGILAGVVRNFKTASYKVEIDGIDHSGDYLLVECLNIGSFGPNLRLNDDVDFGDGVFDVVMIPEEGRSGLLEYLANRLKGDDTPGRFPAVKGTRIAISVDARRVHVDDQLIRNESFDIGVMLQAGMLRFLGARKPLGEEKPQ